MLGITPAGREFTSSVRTADFDVFHLFGEFADLNVSDLGG